MKDDTPEGQGGKFVKGGKPGPGRPKGSKDSIPRMTRKEMSEFFHTRDAR